MSQFPFPISTTYWNIFVESESEGRGIKSTTRGTYCKLYGIKMAEEVPVVEIKGKYKYAKISLACNVVSRRVSRQKSRNP